MKNLLSILAVDVLGDSASEGWIHKLITVPIANNINLIVNLTFVILGLLSLLTAYRIYSNWQAGNSETIVSDISKWFLGMVLCLALISGLKAWVGLNPVPVSGVEFNFE
ncbi:DUF4134 family protein [Larkinella sp. GY13]|uniref:DUF4134 family protein n=1 Tax=Larkinella sp. GY13 TaxID=3453720 RepID=UPI003EEE71F9